MKNKNIIFLLFFLLIGNLQICCKEIQIDLPTKKDTICVYFTTCRSDNIELSSLINNVLEKDFVVDGRGSIFDKTKESLDAESKKKQEMYTKDFWKKNRIDVVITPILSTNNLSFEIFYVRKGSIKSLSSIAISKDREQTVYTIHKFSDFIMKEIYGEKGIASKRILYSYKAAQRQTNDGNALWNAEIYQTDTLGLVSKRVTFENSYSICPEFISTKNSDDYDFVYVSYKLGQPQIVLGDSAGNASTSLVNLRGNQLLPKVSYDGNYLSFISDASGRSDVFIQKVDKNHKALGRPMQIYSSKRGTSSSPHLSPDNKKMTFVCDSSGSPKIYLANIERTISSRSPPTIKRITCPCTECTAPCFSPDGKMIAFSGKVNGRRQIWLYDISEERASQLTNGIEDKENPCFCSDGRHIVYNTTSPTTDLYLLTIANKQVHRLTKGSGEKHYPSCEK